MTSSLHSQSPAGASDPTSDGRRGLPWWLAIAGAAAAAVVVNLLIFSIGNAADASFVVPQPNAKPQTVGAGGVAFSSSVPLAVGVGIAVLLARWWPVMLRVAQAVGGVLAFLSALAPLSSDADGATRIALASMHVVVGVAVVAALEAYRRRRIAR